MSKALNLINKNYLGEYQIMGYDPAQQIIVIGVAWFILYDRVIDSKLNYEDISST